MKTPSLKDKVIQYEGFLHKINSFIISCNNDGIRELIENADNWSYAYRVGNGEISERKQQQLINNAFWKLLNTPKTDEETKKRQKAYSSVKKTQDE